MIVEVYTKVRSQVLARQGPCLTLKSRSGPQTKFWPSGKPDGDRGQVHGKARVVVMMVVVVVVGTVLVVRANLLRKLLL